MLAAWDAESPLVAVTLVTALPGPAIAVPPLSVTLGDAADVAQVVAAVGAVVAALVALYAVQRQVDIARRTNGLDNLWRVLGRWEDERMLQCRQVAACAVAQRPPRYEGLELATVLDTFELLGFLVYRAQVVTVEEAWSLFATWVIGWSVACQPYIEAAQREDPTLFEDLARLAQDFVGLDARRRGIPVGLARPTPSQTAEFLGWEAQLKTATDSADLPR